MMPRGALLESKKVGHASTVGRTKPLHWYFPLHGLMKKYGPSMFLDLLPSCHPHLIETGHLAQGVNMPVGRGRRVEVVLEAPTKPSGTKCAAHVGEVADRESKTTQVPDLQYARLFKS
jgi:hypothetical protein